LALCPEFIARSPLELCRSPFVALVKTSVSKGCIGIWGPNLSVNVLAYDYRGYGKTGRAVSGSGIRTDLIAVDLIAVDRWVEMRASLSSLPMIPVGWSLGSATSVALKLQSPRLVLERACSTVVDVAAFFSPVSPSSARVRNRFA